MFLTFLVRGGFGWQQLEERRVRERPHIGALLYERRFDVPYEKVRAAADAILSG
jgi:hypothetical protein